MKQRMIIWRLCVWPYRPARGCSVDGDGDSHLWGWRFLAYGVVYFWPMGMKILGLWWWRLFAVSFFVFVFFFLEHKTVFLESEDAGIGNSVRGTDRLLHKPKLLMLTTEPHYRGLWIISIRQSQELLLACQGSERHPIVALLHRLSRCCWRNMVRHMSWRRDCFFLSEIAAGQDQVMELSCHLE